jgi:hypothetical protein
MIGHAKSTTSVELLKICKHMFGKAFTGIYSSDNAPGSLKANTYCIINTDPSYKGGIHWCALMSDEAGITYFYDSYRRSYKKLSPYWRNKHWLQITDNEPEQSLVSEVCGHLCIAAIYVFAKYGSGVLSII